MMGLCLVGRGAESEWLMPIQDNDVDFSRQVRASIAENPVTLCSCLR